jgi:single-strand DNA-binding protein
MSINKAILIGNVGKDPEVKRLESGITVANFSLATTENYTAKNGEKVTTTEWHNIVLWRGLAEVAEKYVKKGSKLYIEGKIRTRAWEDKDGTKRYTTEIYGDNMQMLGGGNGERKEPVQQTGQQTEENWSKPEEDDLPF